MNSIVLTYPIVLSFAAGLLCLIAPNKIKGLKETVGLIASLGCLLLSWALFVNRPLEFSMAGMSLFRLDNLSGFVLLAASLFAFLILVYSVGFMKAGRSLKEYYIYMLWTISSTAAAILANNLMLLIVFWGVGGLLLYLLIGLGGMPAANASKKTFVTLGGTDALMVVGAAIVWQLSGTLTMSSISLTTNSALAIVAFLCILSAALAKAGSMPLHNWIPDSATVAPLPVMAFLPASVDKLLGIYLLARLCFDIFRLEPNSPLSIVLMVIGAVTIVAAVMMALIQHNLKKLLSYHAVSQVGYMVLGIGTALPIGIAGGIFHMINNAIYKYCLFLGGGNVESKTGTSELDKLGGLAKALPITFITFLIAAFAISGIPPLNGFVSKWMVYQAAITLLSMPGPRFVAFLCLIAAMFGSALTLASFMKLVHAVFLGTGSPDLKQKRIKEVGPSMFLPVIVLAVLCVVFGVFAFALPLKMFILPAVLGAVSYEGLWNPTLATGLIIAGIILGILIYRAGTLKSARSDDAYVGGEVMPEEARVTGTEFYNTVKDLGLVRKFYQGAQVKVFDLYEHLKKITFYCTNSLKAMHTGVLPTYVLWALAGFVVLLMVLAI